MAQDFTTYQIIGPGVGAAEDATECSWSGIQFLLLQTFRP